MAPFRSTQQLLFRHLLGTSPSCLHPPPRFMFYRGIVHKLFVKGLSFYTTEKELAEVFSQFGQVIEAKIIKDKLNSRSKGFGYVTFASEDEAQNALTEMNGKALGGRFLFVDIARPTMYDRGGRPIARGPPEPKTEN